MESHEGSNASQKFWNFLTGLPEKLGSTVDIAKELIAVKSSLQYREYLLRSIGTQGRKREGPQPATNGTIVQGTLTTPWSELHEDNLYEILQKIERPLDYLNFAAVCKSWHSISQTLNRSLPYNLSIYHFLPKGNAIPMLLQSSGEGDEAHYLYSVIERKVYGELHLTELSNKWIVGSAHGWLAMVDMNNLHMCLFNPITKGQIFLPPVYAFQKPCSPRRFGDTNNFSFVTRVFLSSNPLVDQDNCLLVAFVCYNHTLSFCKIGDNIWRKLEPSIYNIHDVIMYKGLLYAVDSRANLIYIETTPHMKVTIVAKVQQRPLGKKYLVESSDGLLLIVKRMQDIGINYPTTISFQVYRLVETQSGFHHVHLETQEGVIHYQEEIVWNTWEEIRHLTGHILFIGFNGSLCLDPCLYPGSKGNCIYFADDNITFDMVRVSGERMYRHDIGVYHMETRKTEFLSGLSESSSRIPAIWLSPNA